ncbi:MAG TPA: FAD-dependent oxidoreductase [Elusimicrobiota bacterium]|nr:FAD-dependent oxidoreductase [Elusimicrobiota bacterium]
MSQPGTLERPLAVAVVGAGPSGFYAVEALLKSPGVHVRVDLFDRLPTPYGLVRGGVAPDHQKIKSVTAVYEKTALDPRVRFFGNVKLGQDLTVADLRAHYDKIIYAVGCESDRHMEIPGEGLAGSHSATEFVGWYNGHPDHRHRSFDLSCEAVAVVGVGNVAMDVTRVLACDPEALAKTDITGYALDALRQSKVKTIWLLGRRGPAEAAYSPAEIEEIGELTTADLVVDPAEAAVEPISSAELADPAVKKKVEYVQKHAALGPGSRERKVRLRFRASPAEIVGQDGRVAALRIEKNKLVSDGKDGVKSVGTGEFETLPVGMVLRSVGYRGIPVPGVPFDDKAGRIANAAGRVTDGPGGAVVTGEYVVGWSKRGPSGLIGTNRADSVATVSLMLEDWKAGKLVQTSPNADPAAIVKLLAAKSAAVVSFAQWKALDKLELAAGAARGKIREKFSRVEDMIAALDHGSGLPPKRENN